MAFFRQTGTAEAQLTENNWQLFREWTRNVKETDRWIANLSRPGALTAALNWYRANNAPPPGTTGAPPQVVLSGGAAPASEASSTATAPAW